MNAAFAVGRVCDKEEGRHLLLSLVESEHMVNTACFIMILERIFCNKYTL